MCYPCGGRRKKIRKSAVHTVSLLCQKREDKHPASETNAAGLTEGMYVDFCIKKKNMCGE